MWSRRWSRRWTSRRRRMWSVEGRRGNRVEPMSEDETKHEFKEFRRAYYEAQAEIKNRVLVLETEHRYVNNKLGRIEKLAQATLIFMVGQGMSLIWWLANRSFE